jgi:hypothetical protein
MKMTIEAERAAVQGSPSEIIHRSSQRDDSQHRTSTAQVQSPQVDVAAATCIRRAAHQPHAADKPDTVAAMAKMMAMTIWPHPALPKRGRRDQ